MSAPRHWSARSRTCKTLTYLLSHDLKGKAEVLRIFSQVILERDAQELSEEGRRRLGRIAEARIAYDESLILTDNEVEREFLAARSRALDAGR